MQFILPGMGATSEMFQGPWRELRDTEFVNWPHIPSPLTFDKMARAIINSYGITSNDVVGGTSLGGIVALEIALQLDLAQVILIGSAVDRSEITDFLRLIAPAADLAPLSVIQKLAGSSGLVGRMFSQTDGDFIRASCKQIPKWVGSRVESSRISRIHGARDHVIPCPAGCTVIKDGGHLIAITHAAQCVAFVEARLESSTDRQLQQSVNLMSRNTKTLSAMSSTENEHE